MLQCPMCPRVDYNPASLRLHYGFKHCELRQWYNEEKMMLKTEAQTDNKIYDEPEIEDTCKCKVSIRL